MNSMQYIGMSTQEATHNTHSTLNSTTCEQPPGTDKNINSDLQLTDLQRNQFLKKAEENQCKYSIIIKQTQGQSYDKLEMDIKNKFNAKCVQHDIEGTSWLIILLPRMLQLPTIKSTMKFYQINITDYYYLEDSSYK
ncbi:Hypothetical_protein [Hexamita inflata]|uniref:Hypothetical_protein n=1 Tax=Hexamita inflata TaxID=28002 RepID=A0AA86UXP9_9EUKA|nr:Hypothetical protein HINF_LOCUS27418 [Hexamita inflata]CAI9972159.1 Hypothetical protein HINF_LOCUS59804 [Hexamita inflata]